jgi:hypothetical protein
MSMFHPEDHQSGQLESDDDFDEEPVWDGAEDEEDDDNLGPGAAAGDNQWVDETLEHEDDEE